MGRWRSARTARAGSTRGVGMLLASLLTLITLLVAVSACTSLTGSTSTSPAGEAGTSTTEAGAPTASTVSTVDKAARDAFLRDFFTEEEYWAGDDYEGGGDEEIILVTYEVNGDEISSPVEEPVSGDLAGLQDDVQTQEEIWTYFVSFMPADERQLIAEFIIFTDGSGNILAATDQLSEAPDAWTLEVDIADAQDQIELTYTLLHEYAHVLTLNNTQFATGGATSAGAGSGGAGGGAAPGGAGAGDTYASEDEPMAGDSYLNLFYQEFWTDIYTEWELAYDEDYLDEFYVEHSDEFLNDYAATEPEEDIAESWLYFIIEDRPEGYSIAEEKILFFYDFPAMVTLREEIRDNLYLYLAGQ